MRIGRIAAFGLLAFVLSGCAPEEREEGTAKAGAWGPVDVPDVTPNETATPVSSPSPTPSGATPTPTPGPAVRGIDVSQYQATINWTKVKAAGKDFAFIRVSDGTTHADTKFAANWSGAKAAGVTRGAYQFFRASQSASAQAQLLVQSMGPLDAGDIPPVLDVEVMDGQTSATVVAGVASWVAAVQTALGVTPIVYTSPGFWNPLPASAEATTLWVAHWGVNSPSIPDSWTAWTFWQYSATGAVDGITGDVDLDEFHGDAAALQAWLAAN